MSTLFRAALGVMLKRQKFPFCSTDETLFCHTFNHFRSISSQGVFPYKSDGGAHHTFGLNLWTGLVPFRVLKPTISAAR